MNLTAVAVEGEGRRSPCASVDSGGVVALRFIAKDPESKTGASPTVWVDDETGEVVVQGWLPGEALLSCPSPNASVN